MGCFTGADPIRPLVEYGSVPLPRQNVVLVLLVWIQILTCLGVGMFFFTVRCQSSDKYIRLKQSPNPSQLTFESEVRIKATLYKPLVAAVTHDCEPVNWHLAGTNHTYRIGHTQSR